MSTQTPEQLAAAIAALEAQRALLGDAVVDTALAPLREKLAALRAPEIAAASQQLKQVSVLFVDVVGSTAMGQKLDPETIHEVMDSALERFTAAVQAEGGRVLQYTGDGMLAAFGTETASEDDVECAVRAGLRIIEEARDHAPQVKRVHGVPDFNVRVGVHTGRVLLGGGVDAEGSIRGSTVNVAARMEQSAPPGRLRISLDSWRHVRGLFDAVEQEPISVKGVEQPVRSWLIEGVKSRRPRQAPRGVEGVHTRMVGRERELLQLRQAFSATVSEKQLRAVTVVGEAGLGKSRLLEEFQQSLDLQHCWLLQGRAHPRSSMQPHGLVRDMVMRHLQMAEDHDAEAARAAFEHWLAPLLVGEGEAATHVLGQLIGLDYSHSPHVQELNGDDALFRLRAYEAAALVLRRLGDSRPVLLVLDDLHWADEGSLEFVEHLMSRHRELPLLCLVLTRHTLFEEHADWASGNARHLRLDLEPLDPASSAALADSLLQRITDPDNTLRALLTRGAEGNPFYMEELVKMLIDDGVILADGEGWQVLSDKLRAARVPSTLTGVLQARLDALPKRERLALQQAAIVGHVFWERALAAIDPAAVDALPVLLRKQLLARRDGHGPGDMHEYVFHHHLLHQVTYDSVLKAPKREGHARVGAFWSARAEVSGPQEVGPANCRALAEAQYHRCQADAQGYVEWFERQFDHYFNAFAASTLRPLAEQLVGICEQQFGSEHPQTARVLTNLACVMLMQSTAAQAEPLLQRAIAIQKRHLPDQHPDLAVTLAALGGYFSGRGDLAAAEPYFRQALEIRERALGTDHVLTLGSMDHLAKAVLELGRLDEAETLSRRILAAHESTLGPDHPDTAFALTTLGEVLAKRGDPGTAEALIRRALAIQQVKLPPDHPDTGLSMWHLAETLRGMQRYGEAEPLARRALELWEASFGGEHEWTAWGLICLAEVLLALGQAADAAALAERAAKVLMGTFGERHAVLASTLVLQARALIAGGDPAGAEPLLVWAHGIQREFEDEAVGATEELLASVRKGPAAD
jgi:class 3 adenylate cyclase/tetratricopeptide (TPR) repeat protein